jgi:hypothetical protein
LISGPPSAIGAWRRGDGGLLSSAVRGAGRDEQRLGELDRAVGGDADPVNVTVWRLSGCGRAREVRPVALPRTTVGSTRSTGRSRRQSPPAVSCASSSASASTVEWIHATAHSSCTARTYWNAPVAESSREEAVEQPDVL